MKIRQGNKNTATINNQESDKVVIDGLVTAEDLAIIGQNAGVQTIEQLRQLYPKNVELEERELEIMNNDALIEKLRIAGKDNDEKINAFYQNQLYKDKIVKTRAEIQRINKEYEKTREENLIFEKDRKIRELEDELVKYKNKTDK